MKITKSSVTFFMSIIGIVLLFNSSKIYDLIIPSKEIETNVAKVVCIGVYAIIMFKLYGDINRKLYTTTVYILLAYSIEIIAFAVFCYFNFKNYDKVNTDALFMKSSNMNKAMLIFSIAIMGRDYLKGEKFKKSDLV